MYAVNCPKNTESRNVHAVCVLLLLLSSPLVATADLVFHLPCEDAVNPMDASADPTPVVVNGQLKLVDAMIGSGLEFDRSSFVEVADADKLEGMSAITIAAWVRPRNLTNVPNNSGMGFVCKRNNTNSEDSYNVFLYLNKKVYCRINGNGGGNMISSTALVDDTWYHLTLVFDGQWSGDNMHFYVNGELDASHSHPATEVSPGSSLVYIGELNANRGFSTDGITTLSLFVYEGDDNIGGDLYLKINDTKVPLVDKSTYPAGFNPGWVRYNVDLTALDVSNVKSLAVGVEGANAQGVIYLDDIRLYAEAPALPPTVTLVGPVIEAESGAITAPFEIMSDIQDRSGGQYIMTPQGSGNSMSDPPAPDAGWAVYSINIPADVDVPRSGCVNGVPPCSRAGMPASSGGAGRASRITQTTRSSFMNVRTVVTPAAVAVALIAFSAKAEDPKPHPETNYESPIMLAGDWLPKDPHQIDYEKLPRVNAKHAVISDVRDHAGTRVHQHAYLAHHDGRFWAMWSDGPGGPRAGVTPEQHRNIVPAHDLPETRNSFATSKDGLHWTTPADLTGPPRIKGYGWIARGLWKRDGELLALASHFNAPGYEGLGLSLEAFRWNSTKWVAHGTVLDDSMNNFPPKRLPSGEWMMTRRDHQRQVSVMIGGTKAFNDWRINPLAAYNGNGRPEEPYWYILPDGKTIVGLIRDNGRSKFLLRTFSRDNGKTWSEMHRTNFPDATSKFFVHRTSRGYYVMVSNSNPRRRDPLTLAISQDGLVFTKLFWLIGGRHVDYPHIIEHDGHLLVAFSGAKQTMEVMKVSLDELERLVMPESVELAQHLPPVKQTPQQPRPHWIDLGDEGKTLYAAADLVVPEVGKRATLSMATASGEQRIILGIDDQGRLTARLYKEKAAGPKLKPGSRHSLLIRLHSHREKPDELFVQLGSSGEIPAEPESWTLSNTKGSSAANLSRVFLHSDTDDSAGFRNVRIAPTREALAIQKSLPGKSRPRKSSGTRRAPPTNASLGLVARADAPPNVVLIVIDDLGYGDLGCYGSKVHKTPHIDALADAGLRLTDFHTNGPVCSPTRAALMTGQYQQRSGIDSAISFVTDEGVPLEKVTIAELLRKRGYTSGVIGKWHLGWVGAYGPNDQGFDISYCSNNSPDYHSHVSRNGKVDWYKDHELYKENGYLTDLVTRHSNTFIEENKDKPFFLFVSHPALHFPFQGPSDPPFRTEGKLWHGKERIRGKVQPDSKYGPLPPEEYQRAYRDMLEAVDASVGSIVETLDRLDLRRETLIVITSDNGAYSWVGSNGIYRGQKGDLFEGGHRVPAVFNWPGRISEGEVSDSMTMTMDLAPTFAALAGLEESDSKRFDGIDLSELLFDNAPVPVRTLFWRFNNSYTSTHARSVREGKWKYVLEKNVSYLFDLDKDPAEETNLASVYSDRVRDMDHAFLVWEKKVAQGGNAQ